MTIQNKLQQKTPKKLIATVSAFFLTVSGILGVTTIAFATAEGCTFAPSGYVCNNTKGDKARVDSIYVIRGRKQGKLPGLICDWGADASVLAPGGRVKWFRHYNHIGCTPGRAYVKFDVNKTFNCGDETSARFYEGGKPQGGYAIVKLNCR